MFLFSAFPRKWIKYTQIKQQDSFVFFFSFNSHFSLLLIFVSVNLCIISKMFFLCKSDKSVLIVIVRSWEFWDLICDGEYSNMTVDNRNPWKHNTKRRILMEPIFWDFRSSPATECTQFKILFLCFLVQRLFFNFPSLIQIVKHSYLVLI